MRAPEPLFLERRNYLRRRLGDAAKLLPLLGVLLFLLPVLWSESATTAGGFVYLFTVWVLLIGVVAWYQVDTKKMIHEAHELQQAAVGYVRI